VEGRPRWLPRRSARDRRLLAKTWLDRPPLVEGTGVTAIAGGAYVSGWSSPTFGAEDTDGMLWRWRI
jgi:hypothetical protein